MAHDKTTHEAYEDVIRFEDRWKWVYLFPNQSEQNPIYAEPKAVEVLENTARFC